MPTLVIAGARVWTDDGAGSIRFEPRSIWIRDGRIVEVLPGVAAPQPGARPDLHVFDATGKFVGPAFVDAHFHLIALANKALRVDLSAATDARDVARRLAGAGGAEAGPPRPRTRGGEATGPAASRDAIVGVDFDESEWRDATLPTRADLNAVSGTRLVYARRVCCHVGVANDALLRLLEPRVAERFVDRESGRITEDAVFEANRLTRPPDDAVAAAMDGAIAHLHSLGITAIHDIVDPDTIEVYGAGLRASRRPLRIDAYLHLPARDFEPARARFDAIDPRRARAVGIKIFSDGSMGARTAALHEPYADAQTTGDLLVDRRALAAELAACARGGFACAVHAIGDRAFSTVLDAIADSPGARVRIEHAEVIREAEIERAARAGIPLVMQPNFVRNWGGEGGLYERRLGRQRWERNNPFATLLRAGARVVFSSDGMPAGPLYGLKGATHHAVERERVGAVDAFRRYTTAASMLWNANEGGPTIEAGAPADLLVLSGNPLFSDTDRLGVEGTFAEGVEVYRSPAADPPRHSKGAR
ncbi:MAG TPA: amidohydrolase family protein [Candidatus Krumholzibacteria bacterium]|nr:amidohydrolase family protein [Candidatus Krumholzibacteria bacterium]